MLDLVALEVELASQTTRRRCGRVAAADGGALLVAGLGRAARLGDRIRLAAKADSPGPEGEIVALGPEGARAMVVGGVAGVALGDPVWLSPDPPLRPAESWLGRIVDAWGAPLDGKPLSAGPRPAPLRRPPPPAATRGGLGKRLSTGVAALDSVLPLARGQRIGIFAGSGVGKSRLLAQLARGVEADIVVFGLIGERGRELGEFVADGLGPDGMARAVLVVATSDESALARRRAAWTATAVAEHFRDQGRHVLLILDSLTRFAEAHREIALTAGETPSLRAYPPSTSNLIAALAERAGPAGRRATDGAITAIYSVLVAGSDMEEPIADITRGVLDGHVVLDRGIAERGRFPAIDVGRSVSRALPGAATPKESEIIAEARRLLGAYEEARPMIQAGLWRQGADPLLDRAVKLYPSLDAFFGAPTPAKGGLPALAEIISGGDAENSRVSRGSSPMTGKPSLSAGGR